MEKLSGKIVELDKKVDKLLDFWQNRPQAS
jgi:hypothetical protein